MIVLKVLQILHYIHPQPIDKCYLAGKKRYKNPRFTTSSYLALQFRTQKGYGDHNSRKRSVSVCRRRRPRGHPTKCQWSTDIY